MVDFDQEAFDREALFDDTPAKIAQIRQFIHWMSVIVAMFALIYSVAFVSLGGLPIAVTTVVLLAYLATLQYARAQARRGQLRGAALTVSGGVLIAALLIVLVQPPLYPIMIQLPLVAVGVALSFLRGKRLRNVMYGCWLATMAAVASNEFITPLPGVPLWFSDTVRIVGVASVAALVLLLLWQFSARLNATLARMRDALVALQASQLAERRSQETTTALLNALPDLMLRVTASGDILNARPAANQAFQSVTQQLHGRNIRDIFPEDVSAAFMRDVAQALQSNEIQIHEQQIIWEGVPYDAEARVVVCGTGEVLVIVRDLTERRRAEQQQQALERKLLETQRLESIGVLAGGIAHDFNNLLTAVIGNAGIAKMDVPSNSSVLETIERIEQAAQRATELTRHLLAYAGKGQFLIEQANLNLLVQETASLVGASVEKKVALRFELAPDLPLIECDPAQIRQVLLNLVTNAAEAIGDAEGVIELRTSVARIDADAAREMHLAAEQVPAEYVLLQVRDTGVGMNAETIGRIFDPFFTTKFLGRGLGLAAVQGIVRAHRGLVRVESAPGNGATFSIYLPFVGGQADVSATDATAETAFDTVLVIDDQAAVRQVAVRLLERFGFEVFEAADGRAGIELFRNHTPPIKWVLLDLTMPGLNGVEVFAELQRIRPGTPVILMSGYSESDAVRRMGAGAPVGFLQKPFSSQDIQQVIEKLPTLATS